MPSSSASNATRPWTGSRRITAASTSCRRGRRRARRARRSVPCPRRRSPRAAPARTRAPGARSECQAVRKGRDAVVRHVDGPGQRLARLASSTRTRAPSASTRTLVRGSSSWLATSAAVRSARRRTTRRLASRRARAVPRASGEASPRTKRRPSACALSPVVPLPAKTSTTRPPSGRRAGDRSDRAARAASAWETPCALPARAWRSGGTSVQSASTRRSRQCVPSAFFTRKYFTYTCPLAVRCTRPSASSRAIDSSV